MTKFGKKFFGIVVTRHSNDYISYHPHYQIRINSPYELIKRILTRFLTSADIFTVTMAVLKCCGVVDCGWWFVFAPLIVKVALDVIFDLIDSVVKVVVDRERDKYYEELRKETKQRYDKMKYSELDDEPEFDTDDDISDEV